MIYLHTGLPGAGKTLFSLAHVKPLAESEGRQVYYFNVSDLRIPGWIELSETEVLRWYELPAGSIIIIDEAQRIFRPRANGSQVPEHVAKLETHRHGGHDLYLITQHPGLLDNNVRRLVGAHRHIVRAFGARFANVHSWPQVRDNCDKSRKDAVTTRFSYPKEVYHWYKSAELHTHKFRPPARLIFLFFVPVIFIGICAYGYTRYKARVEGPSVAVAVGADHPASDFSNLNGRQYRDSGPLSADEYIATLTPRIPDMPHTAPRYDNVTEPTRAPYPAGCVMMRDVCRCYTDQGTPLNISQGTCLRILHYGFYRDWGDDAGQPVISSSVSSGQVYTARTYDSGRIVDSAY